MFTIDLELNGTQTACNRVINMILSDNYDNALSHLSMTGPEDDTHLEIIADVAASTHDLLINQGIVTSPIIEYGLSGELTSIDNYFASHTRTEFKPNDTGDGRSHIENRSWGLREIELDLSVRKHNDE